MSHHEPELWAALETAATVQDNEIQQVQLEDVVSRAEAGGFARLAFAARHALANAYCLGRQWDRAFPLFARCLSEHDARRHELDPDEEAALLSWYCWIIQSMAEFPAIGLPRIYEALDDVELRHRAAGQNLREVYALRRSVAHIAADWEQEQQYFRQWLAVIIAALIGGMIAVWCFIYRPVREQRDGNTGPDAPIALLVVPEGLVTHGGLDVRWREIEAVHLGEREYKGRGISIHVIVTLNTDDVRDRATGEQRMAFIPFGKKIDVQLGMIPKASRKTTSTVLREQCERVGVPFSSERRVLVFSGGEY
jgi:hypothetical protein